MPHVLASALTTHNLIIIAIIVALIAGIALAGYAYIRAMARAPIPPSETVRNLVAGHYPVAAMFQYRNETGATWNEAQRMIDDLRHEGRFAA